MRSGWSVCEDWAVVLVDVVVALPTVMWMGDCGRRVMHWSLRAVLSWGRIYCWCCCDAVVHPVEGSECHCVYTGLVFGVCLFGWMLWCPVVRSGWTKLTFESYWSYPHGRVDVGAFCLPGKTPGFLFVIPVPLSVRPFAREVAVVSSDC